MALCQWQLNFGHGTDIGGEGDILLLWKKFEMTSMRLSVELGLLRKAPDLCLLYNLILHDMCFNLIN